MMSEKTRLLLVLDFIGRNFPSALYTVQQWANYASRSYSYETVIGATTSGARGSVLNKKGRLSVRDALQEMKEYCQQCGFALWDREVDQAAQRILQEAGVSATPLYSDFNYGSIVNKGLLLASVMSCDYLVRVDPGTRPPPCDFDFVVSKHIGFIQQQRKSGKNPVVSRGYEGRIAVRDIFALPSKVWQHHDLVEQFTGVNVHAQVTGGALFTSAVPGIPAIPFCAAGEVLTLVWASDDGLYQLMEDTEGSRRLFGVDIPRFDAVGKPKTTFEYYRGLAGMVFLSALMRGFAREEAEKTVSDFITQLTLLLDEWKCQQNDEEEFQREYGRPLDWPRDFSPQLVAPDDFLDRIEEGWRNYGPLKAGWPDIVAELKPRLASCVTLD